MMSLLKADKYQVALAIQMVLIAYGAYQDATSVVKYTDIDYQVYLDAARHVAHGGSPYQRHTYRYSPLMAYIMLPCIYIHESLGKIFFSLVHIGTGKCIELLLELDGVSRDYSNMMVCMLWLYNPIALTVSTRGSGDALVCVCVLLTLLLLFKNKLILSACVYGLSVHLKIYPVIFALPIVYHISRHTHTYTTKRTHTHTLKFEAFLRFFGISFESFKFAAVSFAVFSLLLIVFYCLYGWDFLFETYLHHFVRRDNRHNFSPFFYPLYLLGDTSLAKLGWVYSYHRALLY
eukprot:GHVR01055381.1.p1 GENE.GHVR01055381.1~~GHVR01055381.1.p1  ORF type:complete len:290 (+),score=61.08 GHVR01055381.1:108-977(+)